MAFVRKILQLLFIASLQFIVFSCASVPPAGSAKEAPETFSAAEETAPQWQPFTYGIGYFHGKIAGQQIEFWALQIDLTAPGIQITVSEGTASKKVSSFVRDNNLTAGINAVPFDISSVMEGRPIKNMGIVISGGKLIAPANPQYDALVFYNDGTAAIISQAALQSIENTNIKNAAGGFHQILKNNEPAERTINHDARHPRSAAGISADGKYLYLLVIDGRRAHSIGATEAETALLLHALGCADGINFDGGGSSALALRGKDGRIRIVNTPIHGGIPGLERAVAGCIGIRSDLWTDAN